MEWRTNEGYLITNAIPVGEKEFVLGMHIKEKSMFVIWQCRDKKDYFWGHYMTDQMAATKNLCERVMEEIRDMEQEKANRQKKSKEQERGR